MKRTAFVFQMMKHLLLKAQADHRSELSENSCTTPDLAHCFASALRFGSALLLFPSLINLLRQVRRYWNQTNIFKLREATS